MAIPASDRGTELGLQTASLTFPLIPSVNGLRGTDPAEALHAVPRTRARVSASFGLALQGASAQNGEMNPQGAASGQAWDVTVDGLPLHVELVPYAGPLWGAPSSFRVDGVEQQLSWSPGVSRWERAGAPKAGSIQAGKHRLGMTHKVIRLSYRAAVRRNVTGLKRSGPLSLLGSLLGGAGLGGGMAAASQTTLTWLIYELDLDGVPLGSWVAKAVDGRPERWTFVPPGGLLPDRNSRDL